MLACMFPEPADDSEDEGHCFVDLSACVCDVSILDEGLDEAARPSSAAGELTTWSGERRKGLRRHRKESLKQRSALLRFREKTRSGAKAKAYVERYEEHVRDAWRILDLDLDGCLIPLLSTISRAELDQEAIEAATRLGRPVEKPGPSIREGVDYRDFRGNGVLHVRIADWYRASRKRDADRMRRLELEVGALLVAGAPTEIKNDEGLTPLQAGCKYDSGAIVRVLVAAGAEFERVENAQKLRPLLLAAAENSPHAFGVIAETLQKKGALAAAARCPGNGYTVLHYAAIGNATDLIAHAAKFPEFRRSAVVDALSIEGGVHQTALQKAALYGHKDVLSALLDMNADVDVRDSTGATALHVAASAARFEQDRKHKDCVDLLLRKGASIDVVDGRGRTLGDLPTSNNVKRVITRSATQPVVGGEENARVAPKRANSAPVSVISVRA